MIELNIDLIWKIAYIVMFVVHCTFSIILLIVLKKKSGTTVSDALNKAKTAMGTIFKAIGINSVEDAINTVKSLKGIVDGEDEKKDG